MESLPLKIAFAVPKTKDPRPTQLLLAGQTIAIQENITICGYQSILSPLFQAFPFFLLFLWFLLLFPSLDILPGFVGFRTPQSAQDLCYLITRLACMLSSSSPFSLQTSLDFTNSPFLLPSFFVFPSRFAPLLRLLLLLAPYRFAFPP